MKKIIFAIPLLAFAFFVTHTKNAQATTPDTVPAMVSFTFDDGFATTLHYAAPTLAQYGIEGTVYITTDYTDDGEAGNDEFMTWDEVRQLRDTYRWEIGSHAVTHEDLSEMDTDDMQDELEESKEILEEKGFEINSFSVPFGSYNGFVQEAAARYYQNFRGFWDRDSMNIWPYNNMILTVKSVEYSVTPAQIQTWVDEAIANRQWLILVYHDMKDELNLEDEYITTFSDFAEVAAYVASTGVQTPTVSEVYQQAHGTVLFSDDFSQGFAKGWTTDNPKEVETDDDYHGMYPDPKNSIEMDAEDNRIVHLFSPSLDVSYTDDYVFKTYINTAEVVTGETGIYIDEYDAAGNWISGQWKGAAKNGYAFEYVHTYKPTSPAVATMSVQYYAYHNSADIFIDSFVLYQTNTVPEPAKSLVPNGTFEQTNDINGWVLDWTQDTTTYLVVKEIMNPGANTALAANAQGQQAHLFSAYIPIVPDTTYTWTTDIDIRYTQGEFGFYIDEYDVDGNWISGQWKGGYWESAVGTAVKEYQPTSANVDHIRLQYYIDANSMFALTLDNVGFYAN